MTSDWPYDADREDPLTKLRIPVVKSARPEWSYIAAFDGSNDGRPTDTEALMLQSFTREYIKHWYTPRWALRLAERPFDIDGGANGYVFRKRGPGDWAYQQDSWSTGYWPWLNRAPGPLPLLGVLDHVHGQGKDITSPRWLKWKSAHPDVFQVEAPTVAAALPGMLEGLRDRLRADAEEVAGDA